MLGDDEVVESAEHAESTFRQFHDVAVAVFHHHVRVEQHVVGPHIAHGLVDRVPHAQIGPSEVAFHHIHLVRLLQDAVVHGDVGEHGEVFGHELEFLLEREVLLRGNLVEHRGQDLAETGAQEHRVGEEHTRIPEKLAALHEEACELAVRFLGERLGAEHVLRLSGVAQLHIAVARLGPCGLHAQGEESLVAGHEVESVSKVLVESLLVDHRLVGGHHDEVAIVASAQYPEAGPCRAGRRVSSDGFGQDVDGVDVGQLLPDEVSIFLMGADIDIVGGYDLCDAVVGLLQQGASGSEEVDKLFGAVCAAHGPESFPLSSGQNHAIIVGIFGHSISFFKW